MIKEEYDYCPICGDEWDTHRDIACFRKNMLSYVAIADKTKVEIMAESFDDLIKKINSKPSDNSRTIQSANHIHTFNDVRTNGNYCTTCGIPQNKKAD